MDLTERYLQQGAGRFVEYENNEKKRLELGNSYYLRRKEYKLSIESDFCSNSKYSRIMFYLFEKGELVQDLRIIASCYDRAFTLTELRNERNNLLFELDDCGWEERAFNQNNNRLYLSGEDYCKSRIEHNLSIQELSERTGYAKSTLEKFEKEKTVKYKSKIWRFYEHQFFFEDLPKEIIRLRNELEKIRRDANPENNV